MNKPPKLSDDDIQLFRESVGQVKPLVDDRAAVRPTPPPPIPVQTQLDEAQVLEDSLSDAYDPADVETGEELWFCRPGLQHSVLRKLRRGQFTIMAELDLHGMTVPVARQAVAQFLQTCRNTGLRCVRIIHGKGRGSHQRQPVLKSRVNKWLRQRDEVLAFCTARPVDGGTGAVYVLVKRG